VMQPPSTASLQIRMMGGFSLQLEGQAAMSVVSARQRSLLAWELLHSGPQNRTRIAQTFWPDSDEAQALTNLRSLLTRLLKDLPDLQERILITRHTLTWNATLPYWLDVKALENTFKLPLDPASLQETQQLYAGPLLPDCDDEWLLALRRSLQEGLDKRLEAGTRYLEAHHRLDDALQCA